MNSVMIPPQVHLRSGFLVREMQNLAILTAMICSTGFSMAVTKYTIHPNTALKHLVLTRVLTMYSSEYLPYFQGSPTIS